MNGRPPNDALNAVQRKQKLMIDTLDVLNVVTRMTEMLMELRTSLSLV
jgi:hypothetical protein